jgi:hypothetical protein
MLFQNLKAIGEELSEICVLFCKYIYIFIYIEDVEKSNPPLGLVVRVSGYITEMYCVSCEVRT